MVLWLCENNILSVDIQGHDNKKSSFNRQGNEALNLFYSAICSDEGIHRHFIGCKDNNLVWILQLVSFLIFALSVLFNFLCRNSVFVFGRTKYLHPSCSRHFVFSNPSISLFYGRNRPPASPFTFAVYFIRKRLDLHINDYLFINFCPNSDNMYFL